MNNQDKQKIKKKIKANTPFAFIPHRLNVIDRPELSIFPFNVMFMSFKVENGRQITGTTLYEPDLSSFEQKQDQLLMKYFNKYNKRCWLIITYNPRTQKYSGYKFINGKLVLSADGTEWKMFFYSSNYVRLAEW